MKKLYLIAFYLICISAIAQNFEPGYKQDNTLSFTKITTMSEYKGFLLTGTTSSATENSRNTIGKPYINEQFIYAKVNNGASLFKLRYNNNLDVIEYEKSKNEILFLDKDSNTIIEFVNGKKLFLKKFKDKKDINNGYFENVILGNNLNLYKTQKINYIDGNKVNSGYSQKNQPEYKPEKEKFYIEIDEILYPFENPKDIIKLLPKQEKDLKKYLKENKVNLESITDMRKFLAFIDSIY